MTVPTDAQQQIDAYLEALRKGLRELSDPEARDIVEEIRSHILDKAAMAGEITNARVTATLSSLGSPQELARQYTTDDLLNRAQRARSPLLILRSLFRWASLSFGGFWVLLFSLVGYFLAGAFSLCALLKPLHPQTAGLWHLPDGDTYSLRLGFGPVPAGGREMLGWWIVPLGLIGGSGLALLTFHFGVWSIRQLWKPYRARKR
ncbi:MAG TPA: hypothetical protein VMT28_16615 [Terriglobales bacterium]|jgi:hypothetical protein|nr:hypothetical protein [Terriglobales bacterium]